MGYKSFLLIAIICFSFMACSNYNTKGNKPLTEQELRQELEKEQTRLLKEIVGKWATNKLPDSGYGHYLEMTIDRGQNVTCRAIDARDGEKLASIYGDLLLMPRMEVCLEEMPQDYIMIRWNDGSSESLILKGNKLISDDYEFYKQ